MKKLFIILLILNLNGSFAKALEADVFVQKTVNRASDVLSKNISKEDKINGLKTIAKETVDIRGVGFYSLGSIRKNFQIKIQAD
jgi:phospholipid transport system substrate-binding protein